MKISRRGTPVSAQITVLGGKALYIILLPLEMLCNLGAVEFNPALEIFFKALLHPGKNTHGQKLLLQSHMQVSKI